MLSGCCGLELPPEQSFPCTASSFFIQVELWLRTAVLPICNLNNLWYCTHFRSDPPPTDYALHQPEGSEGAGTSVQSITGRRLLLLLIPISFVSELWQIFLQRPSSSTDHQSAGTPWALKRNPSGASNHRAYTQWDNQLAALLHPGTPIQCFLSLRAYLMLF